MFSLLKPFIFKLDPEMAHDLAIKSLKYNFLPEDIFSVENESILESKIFNTKIKNPIGLAAGFDKSAEVYNSLFKFGFGFIEVGTVTPKEQFGNPKPRVFRLENDRALINRLGFNNDGLEKVSKRLQRNSPTDFLGINIGPNRDSKNRMDDYLKCIKEIYNFANYITINISSPNTENLRSFHNQTELEELLKAIQNEKIRLDSKIPIAVKISPNIESNKIEMISEILIKYSVDITIISNTSDSDRESLKNINKLEKGGLSGKPIETISNDLINKFYKLIGKKIKIIGVGGVDSGQGAFEKIINGASLVQLYTGMVYQGPNIAYKIRDELINILKKQGIKNISEAVGTKN